MIENNRISNKSSTKAYFSNSGMIINYLHGQFNYLWKIKPIYSFKNDHKDLPSSHFTNCRL